jgi:phage baseplate assembly protein gpV
MARVKEKVFEMPAGDALSSLLPLARSSQQPRKAVELVSTPIVARLVEFDPEDRPVVRCDALQSGERLVARATVALERAHLGQDVVLLCENGDPRLPIIVGVVEQRTRATLAKQPDKPAVVHADDERYVIEGQREVVLRCGASSITLTRAGKVIIKGTYVLSRSSGYNKIKGAAVDIN